VVSRLKGAFSLSPGERVASVASRVRGYSVADRASDPSPGPRRLVKAPSRSTLSPRERARTLRGKN
jgi:hypothetical protein